MSLSAKVAIALALSVAVVGGASLALALTEHSRSRREEFRATTVEALQLLALAVAPSVPDPRFHHRAQAVLDNIANYPERFPDLVALEVVDSSGTVVADIDPRRYNLRWSNAQTRRDLARLDPTTKELDHGQLLVVVPVRLASPLGVLRARVSERRLEQVLAKQRIELAALVGGTGLVLGLALYVVLQRMVGRRIGRLGVTASSLRRGRMDVRAPIEGRDEITEVSEAFNRMAESLQAYTSDLERAVADRTAALSEANRRLAQLATTDPLTGLANRRAFDERASRDLELARRRDRAFAVVVLDVDRFKSINDRFGHPAGDVVLKEISTALAEGARGTDIIARVGGEEFAVAMPDTPAHEAAHAAERMRDTIERTVRAGASPSLHVVTASFGVAAYPDHGETLSDLVAAADRALYTAKQSGRNVVVTAGTGSP
ncbi:MAG: diguanylate cyclase [Deltaproteobacteria bacterium]|nr:diguanylate cyclase [Deltaproteobacteria bacterium]